MYSDLKRLPLIFPTSNIVLIRFSVEWASFFFWFKIVLTNEWYIRKIPILIRFKSNITLRLITRTAIAKYPPKLYLSNLCLLVNWSYEAFYLFSTLPAFNRTDREAEPSSTWKIRNVHVIRQPFIPSETFKKHIEIRLKETV